MNSKFWCTALPMSQFLSFSSMLSQLETCICSILLFPLCLFTRYAMIWSSKVVLSLGLLYVTITCSEFFTIGDNNSIQIDNKQSSNRISFHFQLIFFLLSSSLSISIHQILINLDQWTESYDYLIKIRYDKH